MSWAEVFKINSNIVKPLNEQIRDYSLMPMWFFTSSTTWSPPKTGLYRIICVGAGGSGYGGSSRYGGGAGGIVTGVHMLNSAAEYNLTVSRTASFDTIQTAEPGGNASSSAGAGTGGGGAGGVIYPGEDGKSSGGAVAPDGTRFGGNVTFFVMGSRAVSNDTGGGGYGAGGGAVYQQSSSVSRTYCGGIGFFDDGTSCSDTSGAGGGACIVIEFIAEE